MSLRSDALLRGIKHLQAQGSPSARLDARLLLAHAMDMSASDVVTSSRQPTPEELNAYDALLARRAGHEPVAYIVGRKEFWGMEFAVGPGVLIPRPDSETLISQALDEFSDPDAAFDVLDLGTGSSILLTAFLQERRKARGIGVERSPDAMRWARQNIARHGLEERATLQGDDWLTLDAGTFDVIFCNPPYIDSHTVAALDRDVRDFEPHVALDGGGDGLAAYRVLAPLVAAWLKPGGRAFFEIGQGQQSEVPRILAAAELETIRVAPDLAGIPRCVVAGRKALETRG